MQLAFATAFEEALVRRNATLTWVRDRLAARGHRVSLATLSYWRSGQRIPARVESLEALSEVEALLELPSESLVQLAHDARRHRIAPAPFDTLVLGVATGEVRGEVEVERVLFHVVVDIDRPRRVNSAVMNQILVANRDGVEGVSMFVGPAEDGTPGEAARIEAVAGCRIGSVVDRPDGIRAARLEFERPLLTGESAMVQVRFTDEGPHVETETEFGLVAEQKLEDCLLWVRFQPDSLPARCWIAIQEGETPDEDEWEVDLIDVTSVHHRLTSFGPGICRIRWEW